MRCWDAVPPWSVSWSSLRPFKAANEHGDKARTKTSRKKFFPWMVGKLGELVNAFNKHHLHMCGRVWRTEGTSENPLGWKLLWCPSKQGLKWLGTLNHDWSNFFLCNGPPQNHFSKRHHTIPNISCQYHIYTCLCVCVFIKIGEWRRSIATLVFHLNSLPSTGSCRSRCCQFYLYILPKASWLVSSVQSDVSTVLGRLPGCWLSQNSVPHRQSIFHSPTSWAAFNWQAMTNLRIMTSDVTLKGIHR